MYFLVLISLLTGACRSCLAPAAINIPLLWSSAFQTTLARVLCGKYFSFGFQEKFKQSSRHIPAYSFIKTHQ